MITGGATGIGFAIARAFLDAGADVVLAGRRANALLEAYSTLGERCRHRVLDVTQTSQCHEVAVAVASTILVNNAGIHLKKPAEEITDQEFHSVWQTHVAGAFALSKAVTPGMTRRGGGSILFISSMAALFGIPSVAAYSSANHALTGLVYSLSVEWGGRGIRLNAIAPG